MIAVVTNLRLLPETDGEVIVHRFVVEEVVFDGVAAIAETENEFAEPMMRVGLHDVPENGTASHLHHGLGTEFGLLTEPGSQPTAQDHHFHERMPPGLKPRVWYYSQMLHYWGDEKGTLSRI